MWIFGRTAAFLAALAAGFSIALLATSPARAQIRPSSDISLIPQHSQVVIEPLQSNPTISASDAIAGIERVLKYTDANLDPKAGAVRALVSLRGNASMQRIPARVVTFDVTFPWNTPRGRATYNTYSMVVNAVTGRDEFGYFGTP